MGRLSEETSGSETVFDLISGQPELTEMGILKLCMIRLSQIGVRVWRNNTGTGWAGKTQRVAKQTSVMMYPGDVLIRQARPLNAGLCVGSSDLVGLIPTVVTAEMIGTTVGIFFAPEVKTDTGTTSLDQDRFHTIVNRLGGIAGIVRSPDDAEALVRSYRPRP